MLMDYSDKTITICDNGSYVEWAIRMAKDFGKVNYFNPWYGAFPDSEMFLPGLGLTNVNKVSRLFDVVNSTDLFFFPDIYFGDVQLHLESIGKRVFGSRDGDSIELFRDEAKKLYKEVGIPTAPYKKLIGMKALRSYLKEHEDVYVKSNETRGDMETWHSESYILSEEYLNELDYTLGAARETVEFIVEDAVNDAEELGYDGFNIDGQFPKKAGWGIEIKDCGYLGFFGEVFPKELIDVNSRLLEYFKSKRYRNVFSSEIRKQKKLWFMQDPCCRVASPPGGLYMNNCTNWADIMWYGAEGTLIEPIYQGKVGAEVIIYSQFGEKHSQLVIFPEKYHDHIKFRNLAKVNDNYYVIPQHVGVAQIGSVTGWGSTMGEAFSEVMKYSKEVKGFGINIMTDSLSKATESLNKLRDYGVRI